MMSLSLRSSSPAAARASGIVFSRSQRKRTSSRRQASRVARSWSSWDVSASSVARSVIASGYPWVATRVIGRTAQARSRGPRDGPSQQRTNETDAAAGEDDPHDVGAQSPERDEARRRDHD